MTILIDFILLIHFALVPTPVSETSPILLLLLQLQINPSNPVLFPHDMHKDHHASSPDRLIPNHFDSRLHYKKEKVGVAPAAANDDWNIRFPPEG